MSLRTKAATLAVAAAFTGGIALSASPAVANPSGGVVHGKGDNFKDDWSDEYVDASSHAHSNVAAMWQAVLWADEYISSTSQIDCRFGPDTVAATKAWQRNLLGPDQADGKVGEKTLTRASRYLQGKAGSAHTIRYNGVGGRYVTFKRTDNGRWGMYIGSDLRTLWYNDATFNNCV